MSLKDQNEVIKKEIASFNARKSLLAAAIIIIAAFILNFFLPEDPADFGVLCTVPALLMIIYIFVTKRIIEALTIGAVVGFIMCSSPGDNVLATFSESVLNTMMSKDIAWLIIVCGLMGGIISLIERSGGAYAFGQWASKRAKSEKPALMWTWVLGCIIFIDDYLNSMTVGSCMAPLTDKHRTPREMLAYVCDSTAAPLCVLIPITTWSVFCGRILVANGWQEDGASEIGMFVKTIPYDLYGWIAALILPLMLMVMAFVFADMNETIGFTAWCIESATKVMTPATMPMLIFLVLAITEFITGTNWGMYIIALPIIIPLAMQIGVHMPLAVAACLSAGVFGSHICFYSDATVLTSAACGCDNFRHAFTQMPYGFIAAGASFVGFAILGFIMA